MLALNRQEKVAALWRFSLMTWRQTILTGQYRP
jgi:hypothetical protein